MFNPVTIVTVANQAYVEMLASMVASANINFSHASLFIELVNCDKESVVRLKKIHPKCEVACIDKQFKDIYEEACFCTNRRVQLLEELRKSRSGSLMWADADILFRKPCDELLEIVNQYDLAVRVRSFKVGRGTGLKYREKPVFGRSVYQVQAGLFSFGPSQKASEMIFRYREMAENQWKKWWANQDILAWIYDEFQKDPDIKLYNLPLHLSDYKCRQDSLVWHGKGRNKTDPMLVKYYQECNKFKGN